MFCADRWIAQEQLEYAAAAGDEKRMQMLRGNTVLGVYVKLDDATAGVKAREEQEYVCDLDVPGGAPSTLIWPICRQFDYGVGSGRKKGAPGAPQVLHAQFPLIAAAAITVHRSQSLSLPQIALGFSGVHHGCHDLHSSVVRFA